MTKDTLNPYEVLNVAYCDDDKHIKTRYLACAAQTHPDKEGGSTDAFYNVRTAYLSIRTKKDRELYRRNQQLNGLAECTGCHGRGKVSRRTGFIRSCVKHVWCELCHGSGLS